MAKKRPLTVREQIKKDNRKRRIGIEVKIMAVIIAIAVVVPPSYPAYYTIVFSIMPKSDVDPNKRAGRVTASRSKSWRRTMTKPIRLPIITMAVGMWWMTRKQSSKILTIL